MYVFKCKWLYVWWRGTGCSLRRKGSGELEQDEEIMSVNGKQSVY